MSNLPGVLYVIATPIGNLQDITDRAKAILRDVDLVLAEDTRHSKVLLDHLHISSPMQSYHDHNEKSAAVKYIDLLLSGQSIALISDAGTPMICDPGYRLVHAAHEKGIVVVPVPGCSALTTALSVAGLPTNRIIFEGFLPEKKMARIGALEKLRYETGTMVFYESPHRILSTLADISQVFGADRLVCLCRELTKKFETVRLAPCGVLLEQLKSDKNQAKGEFVLVVNGAENDSTDVLIQADGILKILLAHSIPVKQASIITAEITGARKNDLYSRAVKMKSDSR